MGEVREVNKYTNQKNIPRSWGFLAKFCFFKTSGMKSQASELDVYVLTITDKTN